MRHWTESCLRSLRLRKSRRPLEPRSQKFGENQAEPGEKQKHESPLGSITCKEHHA